MILESDRLQLLCIEKILNGLGYYTIVGMSSAGDALEVLNYTRQTFDLVIANGALAATAVEVDFAKFCKEHKFVRNFLIYEVPISGFESQIRIQSTLPHPPGSQSIRDLMSVVDCASIHKPNRYFYD